MVRKVHQPPVPQSDRPEARKVDVRRHPAPSKTRPKTTSQSKAPPDALSVLGDLARSTFATVTRAATAHLIAGATIAGLAAKKVQEVAEPVVRHVRHSYQKMKAAQLEERAMSMPAVFGTMAGQLAQALAKDSDKVDLDATSEAMDNVAFFVGKYEQLGRLSAVSDMDPQASERYQAAWAKAVERRDGRQLDLIHQRHILVESVGAMEGAATPDDVPKALKDAAQVVRRMAGDLDDPLAEDDDVPKTITAAGAVTALVQTHRASDLAALGSLAQTARIRDAARTWVLDQVKNPETLFEDGAGKIAQTADTTTTTLHTGAILAESKYVNPASRDEMLSELEKDPASKRSQIVSLYTQRVLVPREQAMAAWKQLHPGMGFRDARHMEYVHEGWGGVSATVLNDNPITQLYLRWKTGNPYEQADAKLAQEATRKFIDRFDETPLEPEPIVLAGDPDWDRFAGQIDVDAKALGGLTRLLGKAASLQRPAEEGWKDQFIQFKLEANYKIGVEGRAGAHITDDQAMRSHYKPEMAMLVMLSEQYPHGIPRKFAEEQLAVFRAASPDSPAARGAATIYEQYLYQEYQREQHDRLAPLAGRDNPDKDVRARAQMLEIDFAHDKYYWMDAKETAFAPAAKFSDKAEAIHRDVARMEGLRSLEEMRLSLEGKGELIQEYGHSKSAAGKALFITGGWIAERWRAAGLVGAKVPDEVSHLLFEIAKARHEVQTGETGRLQMLTRVQGSGRVMQKINALAEEAAPIVAARDMVQDIAVMAVSGALTAGVGAELQLALRSQRAIARVASLAQRVAKLTRLPTQFVEGLFQGAIKIAIEGGKQASFVHSKALQDWVLHGHQDLYDFKRGVRFNVFNAAVQVTEFGLMGRAHHWVRGSWKVAQAARHASKVRTALSWVGSKSHEFLRDTVFFHAWSPLGTGVRSTLHAAAQLLHGEDLHHAIAPHAEAMKQSIATLGSWEAFRHTLIFTVGLGVPLGQPLQERVVKFALEHRLPEMKSVAARQGKIAAIETQIGTLAARGVGDASTPGLIAELRRQQQQLAAHNEKMLEALTKQHPESEELKQQAMVLHHAHGLAQFNLANARHAELSHRLEAAEAAKAPAARRLRALRALEAHAQTRAAIANHLHTAGALSAEAAMATRLEAQHIRNQRLLAENGAKLHTLERALTRPKPDASHFADHVARLALAYQKHIALMEEANALVPDCFPAKDIAHLRQRRGQLLAAMPQLEGQVASDVAEATETADALHREQVLALEAQAKAVRDVATAEAASTRGKSEKSILDPFAAARQFMAAWREAFSGNGTSPFRRMLVRAMLLPVAPIFGAMGPAGRGGRQGESTPAIPQPLLDAIGLHSGWAYQKRDVAEEARKDPAAAASAIINQLRNLLGMADYVEDPDPEIQGMARQAMGDIHNLLALLPQLPPGLRPADRPAGEPLVMAYVRELRSRPGDRRFADAALAYIDSHFGTQYAGLREDASGTDLMSELARSKPELRTWKPGDTVPDLRQLVQTSADVTLMIRLGEHREDVWPLLARVAGEAPELFTPEQMGMMDAVAHGNPAVAATLGQLARSRLDLFSTFDAAVAAHLSPAEAAKKATDLRKRLLVGEGWERTVALGEYKVLLGHGPFDAATLRQEAATLVRDAAGLEGMDLRRHQEAFSTLAGQGRLTHDDMNALVGSDRFVPPPEPPPLTGEARARFEDNLAWWQGRYATPLKVAHGGVVLPALLMNVGGTPVQLHDLLVGHPHGSAMPFEYEPRERHAEATEGALRVFNLNRSGRNLGMEVHISFPALLEFARANPDAIDPNPNYISIRGSALPAFQQFLRERHIPVRLLVPMEEGDIRVPILARQPHVFVRYLSARDPALSKEAQAAKWAGEAALVARGGSRVEVGAMRPHPGLLPEDNLRLARLVDRGVVTPEMLEKITMYLDIEGVAERVQKNLKLSETATDIQTYTRFSRFLMKLSRAHAAGTLLKRPVRMPKDGHITIPEYDGYPFDIPITRLLDPAFSPSHRQHSAKIEIDVGVIDGHVWEIKTYPETNLGRRVQSYNQALKLQRAIELGRAARAAGKFNPALHVDGATVEVSGNVSPSYIYFLKANAPDVELLYAIRLPDGHEVVFPLVEATSPTRTLARIQPNTELTAREQAIVLGIKRRIELGTLLDVLTSDILTQEDIRDSAHARALQDASENGRVNPEKITDVAVLREYERLSLEKRIRLLEGTGEAPRIYRSMEVFNAPITDAVIDHELDKIRSFLQDAAPFVRDKYLTHIEADPALRLRVRSEFAARLRHVAALERNRIAAESEALRERRRKLGYSGPRDGFPLDPFHFYTDVVRSIVAERNQDSRDGNYAIAHTFPTALDVARDIRLGKYQVPRITITVYYPAGTSEDVASTAILDVTHKPQQRAILLDNIAKANLNTFSSLRSNPAADPAIIQKLDRAASRIERVHTRLLNLRADRREATNRARTPDDKRAVGLSFAPRIDAARQKILDTYRSILGEKDFDRFAVRILSDKTDTLTKFVYVVEADGTMRLCEESVKASAVQKNRPTHSTLAGGRNVYAAGEIFVRGLDVVVINNGSGHYRPGAPEHLLYVRNLLKRNGFNILDGRGNRPATRLEHVRFPFVSIESPVNELWRDNFFTRVAGAQIPVLFRSHLERELSPTRGTSLEQLVLRHPAHAAACVLRKLSEHLHWANDLQATHDANRMAMVAEGAARLKSVLDALSGLPEIVRPAGYGADISNLGAYLHAINADVVFRDQLRMALPEVDRRFGTHFTELLEPNPVQVNIGTIRAELAAYGGQHRLKGLEGRIQRGLDPAGMLAVTETRKRLEKIAEKLGAKMEDVVALTHELHVGGIWSHADRLAASSDPAVQVWMVALHFSHEGERDEAGFLRDYDRIVAGLDQALHDPIGTVARIKTATVDAARSRFTLEDGIPFSTHDAFTEMAVCGHHTGIVKDDNGLLFVGAEKLDYSVLEKRGLRATQREDRGRVATFYVDANGVEVVKKLYDGFAIVLTGDMVVAKALARTALHKKNKAFADTQVVQMVRTGQAADPNDPISRFDAIVAVGIRAGLTDIPTILEQYLRGELLETPSAEDVAALKAIAGDPALHAQYAMVRDFVEGHPELDAMLDSSKGGGGPMPLMLLMAAPLWVEGARNLYARAAPTVGRAAGRIGSAVRAVAGAVRGWLASIGGVMSAHLLPAPEVKSQDLTPSPSSRQQSHVDEQVAGMLRILDQIGREEEAGTPPAVVSAEFAYQADGRRNSLVGMIPGLTPELESLFQRGAEIARFPNGRYFFAQHAHGLIGATVAGQFMDEATGRPLMEVYSAWVQQAGFTSLDPEMSRKNFTAFQSALAQHRISLKIDAQELYLNYGMQYEMLTKLLALCPPALLASGTIHSVNFGSEGGGAAKVSEFKDGKVMLFDSLLKAGRDAVAFTFLHEVGHGIELMLNPDQTQRLQAALAAIRNSGAGPIVVHSPLEDAAGGENNRKSYTSFFGEFLAEMNANYILAGDYLRLQIGEIKDPVARAAYQEVYDFYKGLHNGREFPTSGAGLPKPPDTLAGPEPTAGSDSGPALAPERASKNMFGGAMLFASGSLGGAVDAVHQWGLHLADTVTNTVAAHPVATAAIAGALTLAGVALYEISRASSSKAAKVKSQYLTPSPATVVRVGTQLHLVIPPSQQESPPTPIRGLDGVEYRWKRGNIEVRDVREPGPGIPLASVDDGSGPRDIPGGRWHVVKYGDRVTVGVRIHTVAEKAPSNAEVTPPRGTTPPRGLVPPRRVPPPDERPTTVLPVEQLPPVQTPLPPVGDVKDALNLRFSDGSEVVLDFSMGAEKVIGQGRYGISDPAVARQHATLLYRDGLLYIRDNATPEGTFVNNKRIPSGDVVRLYENDTVRMGGSRFTVNHSEGALGARPVMPLGASAAAAKPEFRLMPMHPNGKVLTLDFKKPGEAVPFPGMSGVELRVDASGQMMIRDMRDPEAIERRRQADAMGHAVVGLFDNASVLRNNEPIPTDHQWHPLEDGDALMGGVLYVTVSIRIPKPFDTIIAANPRLRSEMVSVQDATSVSDFERRLSETSLSAGVRHEVVRSVRDVVAGKKKVLDLPLFLQPLVEGLMSREFAAALEQGYEAQGVTLDPGRVNPRWTPTERAYHLVMAARRLAHQVAEADSLESLIQTLESSPVARVRYHDLKAVARQLRATLKTGAIALQDIPYDLGLRQKLRDLLEERRLRDAGGEGPARPMPPDPQHRMKYEELDAVEDNLYLRHRRDREAVYQVLERGRPLSLITRTGRVRPDVEAYMEDTIEVARRLFPGEMRVRDNPYTGEAVSGDHIETQYRLARMVLNVHADRLVLGTPSLAEQTELIDLVRKTFGREAAPDYIHAQRVIRQKLEEMGPEAVQMLGLATVEVRALILESYFGAYHHRFIPDPASAFRLASWLGRSGIYREVAMSLVAEGGRYYGKVSLGHVGSVQRESHDDIMVMHTHPEEYTTQAGDIMGYDRDRVPATMALGLGLKSRDSRNIVFSDQDIQYFVREASRLHRSGASRSVVYDPSARTYRNWVLHPFGGSEVTLQLSEEGKPVRVTIRYAKKPGASYDDSYKAAIKRLKIHCETDLDLSTTVTEVPYDDLMAATPYALHNQTPPSGLPKVRGPQGGGDGGDVGGVGIVPMPLSLMMAAPMWVEGVRNLYARAAPVVGRAARAVAGAVKGWFASAREAVPALPAPKVKSQYLTPRPRRERSVTPPLPRPAAPRSATPPKGVAPTADLEAVRVHIRTRGVVAALDLAIHGAYTVFSDDPSRRTHEDFSRDPFTSPHFAATIGEIRAQVEQDLIEGRGRPVFYGGDTQAPGEERVGSFLTFNTIDDFDTHVRAVLKRRAESRYRTPPRGTTPPRGLTPPRGRPSVVKVSPDMRAHLARFVSGAAGGRGEELPSSDDAMPPPSARQVGGYKRYVNEDADATMHVDLEGNRDRWQRAFEDTVRRHLKEPHFYIPGPEAKAFFGSWVWGGVMELEEADPFMGGGDVQGRIYLSLRSGNVGDSDDSCAAMTYVLLTRMARAAAKRGHPFSFKVTNSPGNLKRADSAVIYFGSKDQQHIYNMLVQLSAKGLFKPNIPAFTAQVHSPDGTPMTGIAFGQSPPGKGGSFGSKRAAIIDRVLAEVEDEKRDGATFTEEEIMSRIAAEFQRAGIDINHPAFEDNGREIFGFIYHRSTMSADDETPTVNLPLDDPKK